MAQRWIVSSIVVTVPLYIDPGRSCRALLILGKFCVDAVLDDFRSCYQEGTLYGCLVTESSLDETDCKSVSNRVDPCMRLCMDMFSICRCDGVWCVLSACLSTNSLDVYIHFRLRWIILVELHSLFTLICLYD